MGNTIDVDMILDKSGSMDGKPLEDVKIAAKAFVTAIDNFSTTMQLVPSIGITAFSTTPDSPPTYQLSPLTPASISQVTGIIDAIVSGGSTAIYDACLVSVNKLKLYSSSNSMRLSMLLTDGEENASNEKIVANVIKPFVDESIPLYTFGYGDGASHLNCIDLDN
jgi:uncharacterized protein with von Willebrand factor type A (vWA) domain